MKIPIIKTTVLTLLPVFLLDIFAMAQADTTSPQTNGYQWGAGLRFSNPSGITLKRYHQNKALEFIVGRQNPWKAANHYYRSYNQTPTGKSDATGWYELRRPWSFQLHYLIANKISFIDGLTWYYGVGAHVKTGIYYYHTSFNDGIRDVYIREKQNYLGFGADAVAGLEYFPRWIPFSFFYDASVYVEGFRNPFFMQFNSGFGIRYRF